MGRSNCGNLGFLTSNSAETWLVGKPVEFFIDLSWSASLWESNFEAWMGYMVRTCFKITCCGSWVPYEFHDFVVLSRLRGTDHRTRVFLSWWARFIQAKIWGCCWWRFVHLRRYRLYFSSRWLTSTSAWDWTHWHAALREWSWRT